MAEEGTGIQEKKKRGGGGNENTQEQIYVRKYRIVQRCEDLPARRLRVRLSDDAARDFRQQGSEHELRVRPRSGAFGGGADWSGRASKLAVGPDGFAQEVDVAHEHGLVGEGARVVTHLALDGAAQELVQDDDDGPAAQPVILLVQLEHLQEDVADGLHERLELPVALVGAQLRFGFGRRERVLCGARRSARRRRHLQLLRSGRQEALSRDG